MKEIYKKLNQTKCIHKFVNIIDTHLTGLKTVSSPVTEKVLDNLHQLVIMVLYNNPLDPVILYTEMWNKYTYEFEYLSISLIPDLMQNLTLEQQQVLLASIRTIKNEKTALFIAKQISEIYDPQKSNWALFLYELSKSSLEICRITLEALINFLILSEKLTIEQAIELKQLNRPSKKKKIKPGINTLKQIIPNNVLYLLGLV